MNDQQLINLVKEKDDVALNMLFSRYIGIVHNVKNRFFLRDYDQDDWCQDGLIMCYESCCKFNLERGDSFGAFFKTNLTNHAYSLLRRELAKRREGYRRAVSYESLLTDGLVKDRVEQMQVAVTDSTLEKFIETLSHVENAVFLHYLGYLTEKELALMKITKKQIQQAKYRCKQKFLRALS